MMKRWILALAVVVCIGMTSCGRWMEAQEEPPREEDVLLTVDGREVPAWRYRYWLSDLCQRVEEQYQASGVPLDWEAEASGGTLAEYVKEQALADTVLYATVENWAEKYGCQAAEEVSRGTLPDRGFSTEQMEELERVGELYAMLYDLFCTEGSPLAPTEEELADYEAERGEITLDRLLIPFGEDREGARKKVGTLFEKLNAAKNPVSVFPTLAAKGADTVGPRVVVPGETEFPAELVEAAQALDEGQCSGIVETEEGFSVVCRLAPDPSARMEGLFDEKLQAAAEQAEVTTERAYDALDPADVLGETAQENDSESEAPEGQEDSEKSKRFRIFGRSDGD